MSLERIGMRFFFVPAFVLTGVVARVTMAGLPNIEPVMLFTLLAAYKYGPKYGFLTGFFTMLISDFYIGMPGTWTLYTAPAFGLVGLIAGFVAKMKKKEFNRLEIGASAGIFTIFYDVLTNIGWAVNWGLPIMPTLVAGMPFSMVHVITNIAIVTVTLPFLMRAVDIVPLKIRDVMLNILNRSDVDVWIWKRRD